MSESTSNESYKQENQYQRERQTTYSFTENIFGKLVFMVFAAIVLFGFKYQGIPADDVHCIVDVVQDHFNSWNKFINLNTQYANLLIQTNSSLIDIIAIGTYSYWLLYVRNIRFMISIFLFYSFRTLHLHMFHMRYPFGYYWSEPVLGSITIPYGRTSDFFYSGHCGFLTICFFEQRALGWNKVSWFTFVGLIYTAFVLIILRVHYSIDITSGVIIAHYIHMHSQNIYAAIEQSLYSFQIYIAKLFQCKGFLIKIEEEQELIYQQQDKDHKKI